MLPARLALCDLEASGWGEPRFPHCAHVASYLTDCCMAFSLFVVRSYFILPYQSEGWYYVIISSDTFQMTINWPADHRPCRFCFVSCFVLFCLCGFCFAFALWFFLCFVLVGCPCTVKAQWIMYRSLFSSSFGAHGRYDDVAIALIHWICKYATGFPACLTTWREPYGVGRKKKSLDSRRIPAWRLRN